MTFIPIADIIIRRLNQDEDMPYELLLLADPSPRLIDSYLKISELYVAQLNDCIIAVYVLCPIKGDSNGIEIKNIAVESRFQGKGLGKHLLSDASDKAREKGFKYIVIGTANSSIAQLSLYQQQGFEITDIRKDFFIQNYPEPIFENGILAKHMIILTKKL